MLWLLLLSQPVQETVEQSLPPILSLYRWLHEHPELSNEEKETAARMKQELEAIGFTVTPNVGGHGLLGLLENGKGPTVLFRADFDGLPIQETTGLPYASKNPGVMHACGHDIHMSNAIGALTVLSKLKDRWKGTLLFVGQPAEEKGAGAARVIRDPKFRRLLKKTGKPIVAMAIHDTADLPAGAIATAPGWVTANVDSVDIIVHGKGGHGARPHESVDPILIGSEIVLALQSIVSRRIKPGTRAVVTVGKFEGGTKHNIIPSKATLLLTVRSYADEERRLLLREIERVAREVASAHRAPKPPEVIIQSDFTPSGYNDPGWVARLQPIFERGLGARNVRVREPSTGGEDFSEYARRLKIPGVMFWVGVQNPRSFERNGQLHGLHSDKFAPDPKPTLRASILTTSLALLDALSP